MLPPLGAGIAVPLQKRPERDDSAGVILQLRDKAARLLPEGRLLPDAVWHRRHRAIVRLCFVSAGLLVLFAWVQGFGQPGVVAVLVAVAGPAVLGTAPVLGRKGQAAATTVSLMAASSMP